VNKELTLDMLQAVHKPARYTGGEFGSVIKREAVVRIALAFPDVYEVGMSYLGYKILYHIVNKMEGVAAERVYAPWVDMEALMRERGVTLATLETKAALCECDLVGFTLQYEMSYTNILNMLDLGAVAVRAELRCDEAPFVIVGGPCVFNPEPLAPFIDLALLGDGEEALPEILECYRAWKREGKPGGRREFLLRAVKIRGVYVPSFYEASYNDDGTLAAVTSTEPDAPAVVYKRLVQELDKVDFPTAPIVPFGEIVHDRIMLEVFKGCSRGCRFCHAGMAYRPVRERSPQKLAQLARELVANTGYNEISLVSLSTADYSCLTRLVDELQQSLSRERVSVSLPSLRIDAFSVDVAQKVQAVRKSGLTFAPEAGSQRMRDVINKGVTEDDLMTAVSAAFRNGWKKIKLYFMLGLPYETDDDLIAIAELAQKVSRRYKEITGKGGVQVTVSVSSFVPKPYTAFQWAAQNGLEELHRKQMVIKDHITYKSINYQYHENHVSVMEGVFARGDRRTADVLERAWRSGERMDGWAECFSYERWMKAFSDCGIDPAFYTTRERGENERFPWEHLQPAVDRRYLRSEYEKARELVLTPDCRRGECNGCGVCPQLGIYIVDYAEKKCALAAQMMRASGVDLKSFTAAAKGGAANA